MGWKRHSFLSLMEMIASQRTLGLNAASLTAPIPTAPPTPVCLQIIYHSRPALQKPQPAFQKHQLQHTHQKNDKSSTSVNLHSAKQSVPVTFSSAAINSMTLK
ncbi:uncharacterized [Tachysurus ichikawai]